MKHEHPLDRSHQIGVENRVEAHDDVLQGESPSCGRVPREEDAARTSAACFDPGQGRDAPIDQLVIRRLALDVLDERRLDHHLVPRPGRNITQQDAECCPSNAKLGSSVCIGLKRGDRRRTVSTLGLVGLLLSLEDGEMELIVDRADNVLAEPAGGLERPDGATLREGFDRLDDLGTKALALGGDRVVGDDAELAEGDDEKLLEAGDGSGSRVVALRVCRVAKGRKVGSDDASETGQRDRRQSRGTAYPMRPPSSLISSSAGPLILRIAAKGVSQA